MTFYHIYSTMDNLIYTKTELEKLEKLKETNDKLEEYFKEKREKWSLLVEPLFESVKIQINSDTIKKVTECQGLCLSYRQMISEEISVFMNRRSKQSVKLKKVRQDKFLWYATSFSVKTNVGEKSLLIDAHVGEDQRNMEIIENYIEYLRQTIKNLESLQYSFKNIVELMNYLGR